LQVALTLVAPVLFKLASEFRFAASVAVAAPVSSTNTPVPGPEITL